MPARARLSALALAAAVAMSLAACGSDEEEARSPTTTTAPPTTEVPGPPVVTATTAPGKVVEVEFRDGSVVGGTRREEVDLGDTVRLRVTSDVADEVHVHGYDRRIDIAAGTTAELVFVADSGGQFEVELENRGRPLLTLQGEG